MFEKQISSIKKDFDITASLQYEGQDAYLYQELKLSLGYQQITCLLGSSGCGKSSLLKQLVSLNTDAKNWQLEIQSADDETLDTKKFQQNIAYMAQQDQLLPWLSVLDNVLLSFDLKRPLLAKKANSITALKQKATLILERVGLSKEINRKVFTLSGGMRQRVALARTLIQDKAVILMDEPFSSLDAITRHKLQHLSCGLFKDKTVLLVTHDPLEALVMGHNVILFNAGDHEEIATPSSSISRLLTPSALPPRPINKTLSSYHGAIIEAMQGAF